MFQVRQKNVLDYDIMYGRLYLVIIPRYKILYRKNIKVYLIEELRIKNIK